MTPEKLKQRRRNRAYLKRHREFEEEWLAMELRVGEASIKRIEEEQKASRKKLDAEWLFIYEGSYIFCGAIVVALIVWLV